jgi:hypothetical protein
MVWLEVAVAIFVTGEQLDLLPISGYIDQMVQYTRKEG